MEGNKDTVKEVLKILGSEWAFHMGDWYGDRGSSTMPDMEEVDVLPFKFVGKRPISMKEMQVLVQTLNDLPVNGTVDVYKHMYFGKCITVSMNKK